MKKFISIIIAIILSAASIKGIDTNGNYSVTANALSVDRSTDVIAENESDELEIVSITEIENGYQFEVAIPTTESSEANVNSPDHIQSTTATPEIHMFLSLYGSGGDVVGEAWFDPEELLLNGQLYIPLHELTLSLYSGDTKYGAYTAIASTTTTSVTSLFSNSTKVKAKTTDTKFWRFSIEGTINVIYKYTESQSLLFNRKAQRYPMRISTTSILVGQDILLPILDKWATSK